MTTATQPEGSAAQYSLTSPPKGASFDWDEVKGDRGQKSLGNRPLLTWEESESGIAGAIEYYTAEGVARIVNGTSVRVTAQSIARRTVEKGLKEGWDDDKINNEIARLQLEYRPGKRQGGQSTAQSRAANAAKKAAGKISGDAIATLLDRVASASPAELEALRALGIDPSTFAPPAVEENDEDEEEENGEQG